MPQKTQVYLTDEQMAALVERAEVGQSAVEIARALACPYATVVAAVRRVRTRGWACPVTIDRCVICGREMVSRTGSSQRRVCSEACARERRIRHQRRRRRERPGQSTPYVRAWRERNPEKVLAASIRESDRWRGKSRPTTEEQRHAHNEIARRGQQRKAEETRALAEHHGEEWSSAEERHIIEHSYLTNTALALELGRTYYAVHSRRTLLRKRGLIP